MIIDKNEITSIAQQMKVYRHAIHQKPELGFCEIKHPETYYQAFKKS